MKALWLCLLLACAGLFVSSSLLVTDLWGMDIPCGASGGCAKIHADEWAHIGIFPTSFFGFATYLTVSVLLFFVRPGAVVRNTAVILLLLGSLASIVLTFRSALVIHALCVWCVLSAAIICLLFFTYLNFVPDGVDVPRLNIRNVAPLLLVAISASLGTFFMSRRNEYQQVERKITPSVVADLLARDGWYGNREAPVRIVMLGDFECPTCRTVFRNLFAVVRRRPDCSFSFVNSPLSGHEYGIVAGIYSKIAAEKGHFWDFTDFAMAQDSLSVDTIHDKLRSYGFGAEDIFTATTSSDSSPVREFNKDTSFASRLEIEITPVVLVIKGDGTDVEVLPPSRLRSEQEAEAVLTR